MTIRWENNKHSWSCLDRLLCLGLQHNGLSGLTDTCQWSTCPQTVELTIGWIEPIRKNVLKNNIELVTTAKIGIYLNNGLYLISLTIIYFLNNFEFGMFVQQKYINIHLPTKWTLVNGFEWQLWWLQWMPPPLTKVSLKLHSLNGLNKVTHCTYSANSEAVWQKLD